MHIVCTHVKLRKHKCVRARVLYDERLLKRTAFDATEIEHQLIRNSTEVTTQRNTNNSNKNNYRSAFSTERQQRRQRPRHIHTKP